MTLNEFARSSGTQCPSDAPRMTSDLPAGDVIVLHDDNGRHAYHALTLAMVALDALSTDQSSRALGCAQGARYGCPKAAASSLEQIVSSKAGSFTHPKDITPYQYPLSRLRVCVAASRVSQRLSAGSSSIVDPSAGN